MTYEIPQTAERKKKDKTKTPSFTIGVLAELHLKYMGLLHKRAQASDPFSAPMPGRILLLGEGNLSFALSLIVSKRIQGRQMIATTFEKWFNLSPTARANAEKLKAAGATVMHGVDAKRIGISVGFKSFDTIIFQFPNVGSRVPVRGKNPSFDLVRKFLISAAGLLASGGRIVLTAVDSPFYLGAFKIPHAARRAGLDEPQITDFNPRNFPGYQHSNTLEGQSAIIGRRRFISWIMGKCRYN